ncbi:hypothetical protein YB2330_003060 [Saitoella coloradoensis]
MSNLNTIAPVHTGGTEKSSGSEPMGHDHFNGAKAQYLPDETIRRGQVPNMQYPQNPDDPMGGPLSLHPSIVDGVRYPRGADYEAQYFDASGKPNFKMLSRIGNPTPLGLVSFSATLGAASWAIMGWQGTSGATMQALAGEFLFFPGLCLIICAQWELILGNSFAFTVFGAFGAYWIALGYILVPGYNVAGSYVTNGVASPELNKLLGFFQASYAAVNFFFCVGSLRTNIPFMWVFWNLEIALILLSIAYLKDMSLEASHRVTVAGGAFAFICTFGGWYLFLIEMLSMQGFTVKLPVGDMSRFWGKSEDKTE